LRLFQFKLNGSCNKNIFCKLQHFIQQSTFFDSGPKKFDGPEFILKNIEGPKIYISLIQIQILTLNLIYHIKNEKLQKIDSKKKFVSQNFIFIFGRIFKKSLLSTPVLT